MKFGKYLIQNSVPEWKKRYLNYKFLKEKIKKCKQYADQTPTGEMFEDTEILVDEQRELDDNWNHLLAGGLREDFQFVKYYRQQLYRVCAFYQERIKDVEDRFKQLQTQCRILEGESLLRETNNSDSDPELELQFVSKSSDPRKLLTEAILEYYRMLQLLENYRILNEIAARKILKKYSKSRGLDIIPLQNKTRQVLAVDEDEPKRLLRLAEEMYMELFENDEEKRTARKKLRIPDAEPKVKQLTVWRAGFMTGFSIPTLIAILFNISIRNITSEDQFLLQVYGGFSIPIFFVYLFSWCLIILQQAHVNWILIFELDPRSFMSPIEFEHFASGMLLFFSVNVFFAVNNNLLGINPQIYIITLLAVFISIVFCPFKTFYYEGRMWVLETLGRVISSGFHPVQFRDFFV
jgi:xenotropic and polytropic retrovirus receptor 1